MSNEAEELKKLMEQYAAEEAAMRAEEEALMQEEQMLMELENNPELLKELDPSFFEKLQTDEEAVNLQRLIEENKKRLKKRNYLKKKSKCFNT